METASDIWDLPQDVLDMAACSWLAERGRSCSLCGEMASKHPPAELWPMLYRHAVCLSCMEALHRLACGVEEVPVAPVVVPVMSPGWPGSRG